MRNIIISLGLFCSTITHAAYSGGWEEMSDMEGAACFCAKKLNKSGAKFWDYTEFKSQIPVQPRISYKDFYRECACADMIFGTACVGDGQYQDVFMPSYRQARRELERVQAQMLTLPMHEKDVLDPEEWTTVLGLYSPGAALGMEYPTPYVKIPYTNKGLTNRPIMSYMQEVPELCVMVSDVFETGHKEFNALAHMLEEILPSMTQEQRAKFRIEMGTAYLENGGNEMVELVHGDERHHYVVAFHGTMYERLMLCAQIHLMDEFLQKPEKKEVKEWLISLSEAERDGGLRKVLGSLDLKNMAYERYLKYIKQRFVFQVAVNDFVQMRWLDQESARGMRIVLPHAPMSAHTSLDLQPIARILLAKGIKYLLEPIFYLPKEGMILRAPEDHARITQERAGLTLHEAPLLTLHPDHSGHHNVENGWLRCCDVAQWKEGDTIGVVLLDPYENQGNVFPTRTSHPHLLEDVTAHMKRELCDHGYNALFLRLWHNGVCTDEDGHAYPQATQKTPVSRKLLYETVRVIWDDTNFKRRSARLMV